MSSQRSLVVVVSLLSGVVAGERNLRVADGAQSHDPTQKAMFLGPKGDLPPSKSPSAGLHKPTWMPSTKPAESVVDAVEHREGEKDLNAARDPKAAQGAGKVPPPSVLQTAKTILSPPAHRGLGGSPTKSPSSGLHKPTWKPSSKPAEHSSKSEVKSAGSPSKSPSSGLHKPTWKPSSKPNEKHSTKSEVGAALPRRELAGPGGNGNGGNSNSGSGASKNGGASSGHAVVKMRNTANLPPSKSPSSGLHKPTWKPSTKPAENAMESSVMEASNPMVEEEAVAAEAVAV